MKHLEKASTDEQYYWKFVKKEKKEEKLNKQIFKYRKFDVWWHPVTRVYFDDRQIVNGRINEKNKKAPLRQEDVDECIKYGWKYHNSSVAYRYPTSNLNASVMPDIETSSVSKPEEKAGTDDDEGDVNEGDDEGVEENITAKPIVDDSMPNFANLAISDENAEIGNESNAVDEGDVHEGDDKIYE